MSRQVTTAMTHNLRVTSTGAVWAEWLLSGQPYGLRSAKDKLTVRALHQALIRSLPGESLLLGVCSGTDPAAKVASKECSSPPPSTCSHACASPSTAATGPTNCPASASRDNSRLTPLAAAIRRPSRTSPSEMSSIALAPAAAATGPAS